MAEPREMSALERRLRALVFFVLLGVFSFAFEVALRVGVSWTTTPGSRERVSRGNAIVRAWGVTMAELLLRSFDAQLEVRGTLPISGRYIIACNHQSSADIVLLIHALRALELKFVAKSELGSGLPFVSYTLRNLGHCLVARKSSRQDITALHGMARQLDAWNGSAVVFPEGTRSRDRELLPYRLGALRVLAEDCDLPLLPIAIEGTRVAADLSQYASRMPRARFTMIIGEVVPAERWRQDVDAAAARAREWTQDAVASITGTQ